MSATGCTGKWDHFSVALCPPTRVHRVEGDGNCLFYSLCYIITGSIREHLTLRSLIVQHLRTHIGCWRLLPNFIDQDQSIDEYIERTRIDQRGVWGSSVEMAVLAHMLGANIASYIQCTPPEIPVDVPWHHRS